MVEWKPFVPCWGLISSHIVSDVWQDHSCSVQPSRKHKQLAHIPVLPPAQIDRVDVAW